MTTLSDQTGPEAEHLRFGYSIEKRAAAHSADSPEIERRRELGLHAVGAERDDLERMRADNEVGITTYVLLQEELDWRELALLKDKERRIEKLELGAKRLQACRGF